MAMSLFVCAATFAVFTYVGPLLQSEAGIPEASLPAMLLLFGIGGAIGLIVGGRVGDGKALQSVVGMFVALAILYGALAAFIGKSAPVWAAMVAWGFLFLAPCIPLQARVVRAAKEEPNLASTLTSPPSMWATRWARRWAPRHFPSDLVIGGCRCSEH
jgi:DHA1 family inner membrane transport protein